MQYTIRELNSTERQSTRRSVRIERIVKLSAPLTNIKRGIFLSPPNEMQYTIRELNSSERKGT